MHFFPAAKQRKQRRGNRKASRVDARKDRRHFECLEARLNLSQATTITAVSGEYNNPYSYTLGYTFTPNSNVVADYLGVYDRGRGLSGPAQVGLWTDTGTLLRSVTVSGGTTAAEDGLFRYAQLGSPITLYASQTYRIGSFYASSGDMYAAGPSFYADSNIQFNHAAYTSASTLAFPSYSTGGSFFGPNFLFGPPTLAANQNALTVTEGTTGYNSGTFSEAGEPFTLSANYGSVSIVGSNGVQGSWFWTDPTNDDVPTRTITITAHGIYSGTTRSASFGFTAVNVPPSATGLAGPIFLTGGDSGSYRLANVTDPSPIDAGSLKYSFGLSTSDLASTYAAAGTSNSFTTVFPEAGNYTVYGRVFDKDGAYRTYSTTAEVAPPAPSQPALTAATDSGTAGDGITNVTAPSLTGTAPAGLTVEVFDAVGGSTTLLGATIAAADGSWTLAVPAGSPMTSGDHRITAKAFSSGGIESIASGALSLTIDTQAPELALVPEQWFTPTSGGGALVHFTPATATDAVTSSPSITYFVNGNQIPNESQFSLGATTVTVYATDAAGNQTSGSFVVVVDSLPTAASGGPYTADVGSSVPLDASASADADPGDSIVSYSWLIGGSLTLNGMNPTLTPAQAASLGIARSPTSGTLAVQLTVIDSFGGVNTSATSITYYTNEPFAALTATPATPALFQEIVLDGSGSSQGDPRHQLVAYSWDFGDGGSYTESAMNAADGAFDGKTSHAFTSPGTYSISFTVTDDNSPPESASVSYAVTVSTIAGARPDSPSQPLLAAASDSGLAGDSVTNITSPTFAGAALPGIIVRLFDSFGGASTLLGSATAAADGTWSITDSPDASLATGSHSLSATAISAAGFDSVPSAALTLVVDSTPPTGSSVAPLAQVASSLTFPVTVNPGADPVSGGVASGINSYDIYVASAPVGTSTLSPFTLWTTVPANSLTATFTAQSNTTYAFHSVARDAAGNSESKVANVIEASTFVPDLTPPVTQIDSDASNDAGTFTLAFAGTSPGGSGIKTFVLSVQVDGGTSQQIAQLPGGTPIAGVYSGQTAYQGLADGASHTYVFSIYGINGNGIAETAHTSPQVTKTFATPATPHVTAFVVEKGLSERSYIRYLDTTFNMPVSSLPLDSSHVHLKHYGLDGVTLLNEVSLDGRISAVDQIMEIDFGSGGIGGKENLPALLGNWPQLIADDGYYTLSIDPGGGSPIELDFYRLFGDVTGNASGGATETGATSGADLVGAVSSADVAAITAAVGQVANAQTPLLNCDINGAGTVSSSDRLLANKSVGRKLTDHLHLDD